MKEGTKDFINALLLIVLCGFLLYQTTLFEEGTVGDTGAALFPRIIISVVLVLSVCLLIQGLFKNKKSRPSERNFSFFQRVINNKEVLFVFITFAFYVIALNYLGYIFSTILFLFVLSLLLIKVGKDKKRWIAISAYNVAFTVVIYFVFQNVLGVFLP